MTPAAKVSLVVVPTVGGGTPAGAYALTRESIESQEDLKNDLLPEDLATGNNSSWKTKEDSLKSASPSSEEFKKLKTSIGSSGNDGNQLKAECLSSYSKDYKSIFTSERTSLKEDIKKFCIHKIGDKLETGKKFSTEGTTDETTLKARTTSLKSHTDSEANGKIDLNSDDFKDLKDIKGSSESDVTSKWQTLRDWCKKAYERGYRGDSYDLWKVVNTYCKKD